MKNSRCSSHLTARITWGERGSLIFFYFLHYFISLPRLIIWHFLHAIFYHLLLHLPFFAWIEFRLIYSFLPRIFISSFLPLERNVSPSPTPAINFTSLKTIGADSFLHSYWLTVAYSPSLSPSLSLFRFLFLFFGGQRVSCTPMKMT